MGLGAFSVSLAVKDLSASKRFYQKLGFKVFGGDEAQNWLIMKNGNCVIGLFQGMFPNNILTFNPGWDQEARQQDSFTDVRQLHKRAKEQGIPIKQEGIEGESGPASFVIEDPDGNAILIDQHI